MRTTQAHRYARWSAIVAAVLAVVVLAIYFRRSWQANQAEKNAPPPVPSSIQKSSQGFSWTWGNQDHTLLVLHASNATEFKKGDLTVLNDVSVTIYGAKGDRADSMRTQSCDYLVHPNRMVCAGDVKMDLQSADEARRSAAAHVDSADDPNIVHVLTKAVTYDRDSGDFWTDAPVQFQFRGGQGHALGANYHSTDGMLQLRHDVHLTLTPADRSAAKHVDTPPMVASSPIEVTGSSLDYHREALNLLLHGPVVATQETQRTPHTATNNGEPANPIRGSRELHANLLTVNLDKQFRARRLTATGNASERPEFRTMDAKGAATLTADQLVTDLSPEGWVERLNAIGNARGEHKTSIEVDHMSANRVTAEMVPKINQPRTLTADGAVQLDSSKGPSTRTIQTAALELDFVPAPPLHPGAQPNYHPSRARTLAPATITWRDPAPGQASTQQRVTRASGQRVEVAFDERNRMRRLQAHGNTELDRDTPGFPRQTSTSQELAADFDALGQWTTMDQSGNVRLREADRSAQAVREHVDHATNIVTLTGSAEAADATTHTTADTISFDQGTSEMRAEGHVLTTYRNVSPNGASSSGRGSAAAPVAAAGMGTPLNFGPEPAHITSEHLVGNSASGQAIYTGHARLWQGDSTMEADEIELNRDAQQLDARGNVRAVFLQVNASPVHPASPAPAGRGSASATRKPAIPAASSRAQPDVIRIRAGTLTYWNAKSEAHLAHGFTGESQQGIVTSQECELFFTPSSQPSQAGEGTTERLDHAIATGNVVVRQPNGHATGDRGEYEPAAGKFILSGGNPTIYDASGNPTSGRQLTFFLADDTILVESDENSRVLTRYQVKK